MTRRALIDPFVVGPPRAVSARTRLFPSDVDETVLREIGEHLGSLLRSDLAARCRLGAGYKHLGRAKRKRTLTPRCSSRWAGAITRVSDDMWERELLNLEDLESRDRKEIAELDRRLVLPAGKGKARSAGTPLVPSGTRNSAGWRSSTSPTFAPWEDKEDAEAKQGRPPAARCAEYPPPRSFGTPGQ